MEYQIECRSNKKSPGNYDAFIVEAEDEFLIPLADNSGYISDVDKELFIRYASTSSDVGAVSLSGKLISLDGDVYNTTEDCNFSLHDVVSLFARTNEFGQFVIHENENLDSPIHSYLDFKKDHPTFDLKRYDEFWNKYDAAFEKFRKEVPDWFKNE